jgi:surfeit locus 1 family protein
MTFRPYPGFTIFAALMIAFLCGLGVWQVQRLHWKLDLIARIQAGLSAPPRPLGTVWTPSDLAAMDYKKVTVHGRFLNTQEVYFFATGSGGVPDYHVLTPFVTATGTLLVDRGEVPAERLSPATRTAGQPQGEVAVTGVLRKPDAPNLFTPQPDKLRRVTYTRHPATVAATFALPPLLPMFLEADATPNPGGWPKGGQTVIDLPNNHLSYAVTWFGLAAGLFGVWLAYHISKGRLAWK